MERRRTLTVVHRGVLIARVLVDNVRSDVGSLRVRGRHLWSGGRGRARAQGSGGAAGSETSSSLWKVEIWGVPNALDVVRG
jgi:hypothetical protein